MITLFKILLKSCDTCSYEKWPKNLKCKHCKERNCKRDYKHLKGDANEVYNRG